MCVVGGMGGSGGRSMVCVCLGMIQPDLERMWGLKGWRSGFVLPWRDSEVRLAVICFPGSPWKREADTPETDPVSQIHHSPISSYPHLVSLSTSLYVSPPSHAGQSLPIYLMLINSSLYVSTFHMLSIWPVFVFNPFSLYIYMQILLWRHWFWHHQNFIPLFSNS